MKNIIKKSFLLIIVFVLLSMLFIKKNISANETIVEEGYPTCYQQGDPRWSSHMNGDGSIGSSACGLLSTVNSVNYLTGNFIDPVELADYAYEIEAYNTPSGGGTWRYILYPALDPFEQKYGFKITTASVEKGVGDSRMIEHLQNGGAVIGYVYGHFIAIVDYDANNDWYLVYDSAANINKRYTYAYPSWLTSEQLSTSEYMTVTWFCLVDKTFERSTQLDGFDNLMNGKAEACIYAEIGGDFPTISGYAFDTRGINRYYYVVDYDYKNCVEISSTYRKEIYDQTIFSGVDFNKTGFLGCIDTSNMKVGNHTINVFAETLDGGVLNIAEIDLCLSDNKLIDEKNRTFTLNLSTCNGETDVRDSAPIYGCDDYCFVANYNTCLRLGKIDLGLFKKVDIIYSTSASFDSDKDGIQSVIGFKRVKCSYGYHGTKFNPDYSLCYANMTDGGSGYSDKKTATIDLTKIDYNGPIFLNGYNQESQYYVVDQIVFYYNDDITLLSDGSIINLDNNYFDLSSASTKYDFNTYSFFNLGRFNNLTSSNYVIIKIKENESYKDTQNLIQLTTNGLSIINQVVYNGEGIYVLPFKYDYSGNVGLKLINGLEIEECYMSNSDYIAYVKTNNSNKHLKLCFDDCNVDSINYHYVEEEHVIVDKSNDATCLKTGLDYQYCSECNDVLVNEITKALGHTSSELYYNDDHHYKLCDRCNEIYDEENHDFELLHNSKYHYDVCKICEFKTHVTAHTYDSITHYCVCGVFDPKICQHTNTSVIPKVEPTCNSVGYEEKTVCDKCHEVISGGEEIPVKSHNYVDGKCSVCESIDPDYQPPTKKGCKKNIVSILALTNGLTFVMWIFLKKKH